MYIGSCDLSDTWKIELQLFENCSESPFPRVSVQPQLYHIFWLIYMPQKRATRSLSVSAVQPHYPQLETQLQAAAGGVPGVITTEKC